MIFMLPQYYQFCFKNSLYCSEYFEMCKHSEKVNHHFIMQFIVVFCGHYQLTPLSSCSDYMQESCDNRAVFYILCQAIHYAVSMQLAEPRYIVCLCNGGRFFYLSVQAVLFSIMRISIDIVALRPHIHHFFVSSGFTICSSVFSTTFPHY